MDSGAAAFSLAMPSCKSWYTSPVYDSISNRFKIFNTGPTLFQTILCKTKMVVHENPN